MSAPDNDVKPRGFPKLLGWIVSVALVGAAVAILLVALGGGDNSSITSTAGKASPNTGQAPAPATESPAAGQPAAGNKSFNF